MRRSRFEKTGVFLRAPVYRSTASAVAALGRLRLNQPASNRVPNHPANTDHSELCFNALLMKLHGRLRDSQLVSDFSHRKVIGDGANYRLLTFGQTHGSGSV